MGNNNTKYKMENNNVDSLTQEMNNMNVDIEIQPWIRDMSTNDLRIAIREIAGVENYQIHYPGIITEEEDVNDSNSNIYKYNLAVFLTNLQRAENQNNINLIMNMSMEQLRQFCRDNNISNYSGKNKYELQQYILNSLNS